MSKKTLIAILALGIIAIIFVYNDDFLYSKSIMRIDSIEEVETDVYTNTLGFKETHYYQKITGTVTNGADKGKVLTRDYESTYSSLVTDKYRIGDKVFVNAYEIDGLKRDVYLVILIFLFVLAIYLVGQQRGLLAVVSVLFNSSVFYFGLRLYFAHFNLTVIAIIEAVIFTCTSLFIASGINKKSFAAILSVFASSSILFLALFILMKVTNYSGINFNEISFITVPYLDIILPSLFIGTLGAVMDVAITMSSSLGELLEKDANISTEALKKSGMEIGKDIMSTMVNVLFFTYLCSELPIFVLALRNGFSFYNYVTTNFSLELTRFLVGGIGIVMTIPIAISVSIKVFKKEVKR